MLAVVGGGTGLWFAWLGLRLLRTLSPAHLPRLDEISIDPAVLLFTLTMLAIAAAVDPCRALRADG